MFIVILLDVVGYCRIFHAEYLEFPAEKNILLCSISHFSLHLVPWENIFIFTHFHVFSMYLLIAV